MERKLAHIEKIEWIKDIPGADKIQVCGVLGWECVIKRDEFKVGDKIIYVEIDSVMPDKPEYEFLRERKFRIKTIKLKGQISQGLVLPLPMNDNLPIGTDVTEELGITKYLSPSEQAEIDAENRKIAIEKNHLKKFMMRYTFFRRIFLPQKQRNRFPYWVSKTDEERIQALHWEQVYEQFKDKEVYITEKIDYQSATFTGKMLPRFTGILGKLVPIKRFQFVVCSRNFITNDKNNLYWKIARKYQIESILKANPTLTIQGEQGDTNIQGNKYGIKEPKFWVFNIIDHEKGYHYDYHEMAAFCAEHNLPIVPLLYEGKLHDFARTVPEFVERSKGYSLLVNVQREGIVVRCIDKGKKLLSFKVISPEFLLKHND